MVDSGWKQPAPVLRPRAAAHDSGCCRRRFVLGLAGPSGSGKSAAAALMKGWGARVVSGDTLGREALAEPGLRARVRVAFGFDPDDRRRLSGLVFRNPGALARLSAITWPWIASRARGLLDGHRAGLAVLDAAVLLDAGWASLADSVLVFRPPESVRLSRLLASGLGYEAALSRIRAQSGLAAKPGADEVWGNLGSRHDLAEDLRRYLARVRAPLSA